MGQRTSWPRVRYPSLRRRVVIRPVRGILTAQSWPHKRRGPRHPTNAWWSEWLRQADLLWNYLPDTFRRAALSAARGSPQMPRDLGIAAMRGRLWTITYTDGVRMYPMAAARDVSESLDVLSQLKGTLLVRGDSLWTPVAAGLTDDDVLAWSTLTGLPAWQARPPALLYTPPLVADFPLIIGTPLPTPEQAPTRVLVVGRTAVTPFPRLCGILRPLATPPQQYTFALTFAGGDISTRTWGLILRDNATSRCISFGQL